MCRGTIVNQNASFMVDIDNRYFIIKNVPSQVCDQCGETSYNDEVAGSIETLIDQMKKTDNEIVLADFNESKKNEVNKKFVENSTSFEVIVDDILSDSETITALHSF
jgi:YgiT-type zinc finger domain-containing protein